MHLSASVLSYSKSVVKSGGF